MRRRQYGSTLQGSSSLLYPRGVPIASCVRNLGYSLPSLLYGIWRLGMRSLQARMLTPTRMCSIGLDDCNAVCLGANSLLNFHRPSSFHQTQISHRTRSFDDVGRRQAGESFSLLSLRAVRRRAAALDNACKAVCYTQDWGPAWHSLRKCCQTADTCPLCCCCIWRVQRQRHPLLMERRDAAAVLPLPRAARPRHKCGAWRLKCTADCSRFSGLLPMQNCGSHHRCESACSAGRRPWIVHRPHFIIQKTGRGTQNVQQAWHRAGLLGAGWSKGSRLGLHVVSDGVWRAPPAQSGQHDIEIAALLIFSGL